MGRKASHVSVNRPVGTVSLTFDNLGEAAEIEMGALPADALLGGHRTATEVVPALLGRLAQRGIAATFFVEGMNAELYPDLLREVAARGHEVAYHAWRHEQWDGLSAAGQAENLMRGIDAFARIGIEVAGLRPPGGRLGPGGVGVLREAGLRYCSPAGAGAGVEDGVALLPFEWRHLDASCVLPPLAGARERMTGSPDPVEPATFVAFLGTEIERLGEDGGHLAIVLHPFMLEWLGEESLSELLDRIASARDDGLEVARCRDIADRVLADPDRFANGTVLDATSWA
jgi:peptidoglycan/xylan/chitin deacetylase (PgdA/CDA1 family)